jgi:hypothetical protein
MITVNCEVCQREIKKTGYVNHMRSHKRKGELKAFEGEPKSTQYTGGISHDELRLALTCLTETPSELRQFVNQKLKELTAQKYELDAQISKLNGILKVLDENLLGHKTGEWVSTTSSGTDVTVHAAHR